jgi:hypothetical protein
MIMSSALLQLRINLTMDTLRTPYVGDQPVPTQKDVDTDPCLEFH